MQFSRWAVPIGVVASFMVLGAMLMLCSPKWLASAIENSASDRCSSANLLGFRLGMSRRDVMRRAGIADGSFAVDWYVQDPLTAEMTGGIKSALWTPGFLPDHLRSARSWTLVRAGYGHGYEVVIEFDEEDRLICADLNVEMAPF